MKKCLVCDGRYPSDDLICVTCGFAATKLGGFVAYAPSQANGGGGFQSSYFAELNRLESGHFWFRARNRLIIWAISKYCPTMSSFLEIGCGTGYVLSGIANVFRDAKLHASEIFLEGLSFAAARQPSINFMQMDARTIPFVEEFDCIGAFDVLEHIEEDQRVLTQAFEALRPGGILLLTVPQHAWLWSAVDDYACHVRRYSSKAIRESVEMAGFEILRSTSFVFTLLPAMWLSRQFQRISGRAVEVKAELEIPASLNHIFAAIMRVEEKMIRTGMSLPIGGSRMVVARKR